MIQTRKLEIPCPTCGSLDVFYSCTPSCCFNHVCDNCRTTFQTASVATQERRTGATPPNPVPDGTGPAVACAKCESVAVYRMPGGDDTLVCAACGALLRLELTEVAPG